MRLVAAVLDNIGLTSQSWDATLGLFSFKSFYFPLRLCRALGGGGLVLWSRRHLMSGAWTKLLVGSDGWRYPMRCH